MKKINYKSKINRTKKYMPCWRDNCFHMLWQIDALAYLARLSLLRYIKAWVKLKK